VQSCNNTTKVKNTAAKTRLGILVLWVNIICCQKRIAQYWQINIYLFWHFLQLHINAASGFTNNSSTVFSISLFRPKPCKPTKSRDSVSCGS